MSDELVRQWKVWEKEYVRHNLWRRRMWFWFVMSWAALIGTIFVAVTVTLSIELIVIVFVIIFIVWTSTLVAAIAFGLSERVARQELVRLDKLLPPDAERAKR